MADHRVTTATTQDATNRAWRSFLQGLGIDVLVAVSMLVYTIFDEAEAWGQLEWGVIGFSLLKTVLVAVASFVMRRFMDPSRFPTPKPPANPGPPAVLGDPAP